ncbi:SDR family oxidoreductase [Desemzia incerta]|uniref:3-oxoacyl-[acyl-carrier protein] reductase n=2 Tax=Desemzia incerta TaxID=82801 RepID=A0A1I5W6M2_9LACT|nr:MULTISPECIES: SDR family oxidoreductase [Desemzia]MCI3029211.1 SDR family oxidoreductase [Desemzia sp. C1]WHZ31213.1 SDR family oxidoreductase [Desemzia incerta]SFQ15380.1 3-oxoacyl-[acyl-carrier protein] reductase [Desemzia incerta]
MDLGLTNKVVLVVASSKGLGKAVAKELAKEGANVMLTSRSAESLKKAAEEIQEEAKGKIAYFPADITKPEDIKSLVKETREKLGKIDVLVNNAGGPPSGNFLDFNDEDWEKAFQLNLFSYIRLIREVLPDLKQEGGKILNIASSSVKAVLPNLILSNTFRNGINGLSKSLAIELAPDKILVNTIGPGRIATDRIQELDQAKAEAQNRSLEEVTEESEKSIPAGRYGEPEEFAKAAVFLVSGANTYVTGQSLLVDGGMVTAI